MRKAIDFLDEMVRDFDSFNLKQMTNDLVDKDFTILVLPAYPPKPAEGVVTYIANYWKAKHCMAQIEQLSPLSVTMHIPYRRLHLVMAYEDIDIRGVSCVGALIDDHRLLDKDTQRSIQMSMQTVRGRGFPVHSVVTPINF